MQHTHRFLLPVVLSSAALFASTNLLKAQVAPTPPIGAGAIDESSLVLLKGNHHPLANASNDRGPAAPDLPMERMLLVLKRDPAAESALRQWIADQQDKTSPRYHAWLSPEEFANRFGPSESDRQKAAAWLVSHGFRVNRLSRGGMAVEFSGTAAQVTEAFHTSIHRYLVNGENHYANSSDPQIPAALSPIIAGVSTLHDFQSHSTIRVLGSANRVANSSLWQPDFTFTGFGGTAHYLAPGDFAKIYNVASLRQSGIDGTGQSIAIVARTNINLSDIQVFRLAFGLPSNDPQIILDGPDPGNFFGLEEAEADLDVEWSGAVAPKATIKLVVSASTNATDGVDLSALYIVETISLPSSVRASAPAKRRLGKPRPPSSTTCGSRPPPKASRSLSPAVILARPDAIFRRARQPLTDSLSTVWPPRLSTSRPVGRSSTKTEPTAPTGRPPTGPTNPQRLATSRKQPGMRAAPTPRSAAFSRFLQPAAGQANFIVSPPGRPGPAYPPMASAICRTSP